MAAGGRRTTAREGETESERVGAGAPNTERAEPSTGGETDASEGERADSPDREAAAEAALADLAFLSRSPNRLDVLRAAADGPLDRSDVRDRVAASRVTVGRALADLEDRSWVRRTERGYATTAAGEVVLEAVEDALGAVGWTHRLDEALELLPAGLLEFDVAHLSGAAVTRASPPDPFGAARAIADLVDEAAAPTLATDAAPVAETVLAALPADATLSVVAPDDVVDALAEVDRRPGLRGTGDGTLWLYRCDDAVPVTAIVLDERVGFVVADDVGRPRALVEVADPVVCEWAASFVAARRTVADRVPAEEPGVAGD